MNKVYSIFIIIFFTILLGQTTKEWVEKMPVDDEYHYARENIGTHGMSESEYKAKADKQAMKTISMQIHSTVSGKAESSFKERTTESDGAFVDEFEETSFVTTLADIEGAEKVD
ncbi:uncharacterized protein METZ01_LOCUS456349, partial [marine metagenome]